MSTRALQPSNIIIDKILDGWWHSLNQHESVGKKIYLKVYFNNKFVIWGSFSVDNATLNRFFSLHFLLPFVLAALVILHLIALEGLFYYQ